MATVGELQAILTLNTAPFVAGMKSAEASSRSMGQSLTTAGMGIAALGGAMLIGLGAAARAAEEENAAIVKLNTAIGNSPALVGASADAFLEQAAALQDTTTFADDATIASQAMLATFRLTQEEILGLTPLVGDLAAMFDMDLVQASKLVGKAMQGNVGALQRAGIQIDETAFATDRYGAVLQALQENAGGAAEALGDTFSGRVQILKNNMGDLAEGVGVGAVEAFETFLGPVMAVSDALQGLSPGTQAAIGKVGGFAAIALVGGGAALMLAGAVLKTKAAYIQVKAASEAAAASQGVANASMLSGKVSGLALAGGIAAAVAAAATWAHAMDDLTVEWDIDELLSGTSDQLRVSAEQFQWLIEAGGDAGQALDHFRSLAEMNIEAAQRFGQAWIAAGGPAIDIYLALGDAARASRDAALGLDENATSAERLAAQYDNLVTRIDEYLNRVQSAEEAAVAEAQAQQALFESLVENGRTFDTQTAKGQENIQTINAWIDAVGAQVRAAAEWGAQTGRTGEAQGRMNARIREAIGTLRQMHEQGLITDEQFRRYSRTIRGIPNDATTNVNTPGADEADATLGRIKSKVDQLDGRNVTIIVDADIRAGANQILTGGFESFAPNAFTPNGPTITPITPSGGGGGSGGPGTSGASPEAIGKAIVKELAKQPLMTVGVG